MKKIILVVLVGMLGFSVGTAQTFSDNATNQEVQNTGMKSQLETDRNMRALLIQFENNNGNTREYLESLSDNVREILQFGDEMTDKARYTILVNRAINDPYVEINVDIFGRLTETFWSFLDYQGSATPIPALAEARLDTYKEFYNAIKDISGKETARNYILPTISIWRNCSYNGLVPSRTDQALDFWYDPQQAGKMYNAMAEVNHEDAKELLEEYLRDDCDSAYPSYPQESLQEIKDFFSSFATSGKFAKEDAPKLQDLVLGIIEKKGTGN